MYPGDEIIGLSSSVSLSACSYTGSRYPTLGYSSRRIIVLPI
ncbi:D-glucarate permease [Pantoea sp. AS-PWVM4]|nr:D-glucarate permease [Pantoea sp. AS-PWVM4]